MFMAERAPGHELTLTLAGEQPVRYTVKVPKCPADNPRKFDTGTVRINL
jgi:hypothetical protein